MGSSDVATLTGAALVFYPEDHSYWTPPGRDGGQRIVNVTTVLKATGISADFEAIERMNPDVAFKRDLGSAVHADCHAYDDEDLRLSTVDPRVLPYVRAWAAWREAYAATPLHRERCVFHPVQQYCGTLDGIFAIRGKHVLIDLKCGDPDDAGARWQTAAYEAAYRAEFAEARIDERWSVQLTPGAAVPYRVTPYRDYLDYQTFLCFLTTYRHQHARRRSR